MQYYNFTFKFKLNPSKDLEKHLDELCDAGCDDALVGCGHEGWLAMEFSRKANNIKTAVETAAFDVRTVIGQLTLIEIEYDVLPQGKDII